MSFIVNIGNSKIVNLRDSVKIYYSLINKAELSIVDSNYFDALKYYLNASEYKWLNADDLFNAGIAAYLINDTSMSIYFLNSLAANGLKKTDFENREWGQSIKNDKFYKYISKDYDSIFLQSSQNSRMKFYGQQMETFYKKDQSVRGVILDKDGRPERPAPEDPNRLKIDHENRVAMLEYVSLYGFPSFKQTGFYDRMKASDASGTYWILWWHRCPDTSLEPITLKAVLEGDFPPDDYALSIERCRPLNGELTYHLTPDTFYTQKQIQQINEKRKQINLDPLEDYIRKLKFYDRDRRFLLLNDYGYGLYKVSRLNLE